MDDIIKTDYFIKLPSEADMPTALRCLLSSQDSTTVVDPETGEEHVQLEGEPYLVSTTHDYAIDLVGVIYEPTGETLTDDEGNEYPETAPLDGYHLNIRLLNDTMREAVEAIEAEYGLTPNSPSRVWA
jgi:hypothetical protein